MTLSSNSKNFQISHRPVTRSLSVCFSSIFTYSYLNLISHTCLFSLLRLFRSRWFWNFSTRCCDACNSASTTISNLNFDIFFLVIFILNLQNLKEVCILFLYQNKESIGVSLCLHYSWYTDKFVFSIFLHDVMMLTLIPWTFSFHAMCIAADTSHFSYCSCSECRSNEWK